MSDDIIVNLYKKSDYEALEKKFDQMSKDAVSDILNRLFTKKFDEESIVMVKALLLGLVGNCKHHGNALERLYQEGISLLQKNVNKELLSDLLLVLNNEMNNLDSTILVSLCEYLLNSLKSGSLGCELSLKLFQKLIDVLPQHSSINDNDSLMTGVDFKQLIISRVCSFKWTSKSAIRLISMLKEVRLSSAEADIVVKKLVNEFSHISSQELPPYVFQVLSLANTTNKAQAILEGIVHRVDILHSLLNERISSSQSSVQQEFLVNQQQELIEIEGTVLLYISNALKQNQFLGKSILKKLKSLKSFMTQAELSPFFIALCFLLVQDGRLSGEVLSSLRSLLFKSLQDIHKRKSSRSLHDHSNEFCDMKQLMCEVVDNCAHGWDYIVDGIVQLGFSLMSAFGPKQGPFGKGFQREFRPHSTPQNDACNVGLKILSSAFKNCKFIRSEILRKVLNSIQVNLNAPAYHYIKLLKSIAKTYSQSVLQSMELIKIMLDDLVLMNPYNAEKLFCALLPIIKMNSSLRSSFTLVLRKTLSMRGESSRICALQGFLFLLENFPVTEVTTLSQMSSQSSQSIFSSASIQSSAQHSSPGAAYNHMLCMEILQTIKRCLLQQFEVRKCLYLGMRNVIVKNSHLSSVIIEALLEHLKKFYEDDSDIIPPISIASCIAKSDGGLQEPLPLLLATISFIARNTNDDYELLDEELLLRVNSLFASLSTRLCKCEPNDFGIGSSSNSSQSNSQNSTVLLVLLVHQVLIEHWMNVDNEHQKVLDLFEKYKKCYDEFNKTKAVNFDKHLTELYLSSSHFNNLFTPLFAALSDDDDDNDETLATNEAFLKHSMSLLRCFLHYLSENGYLPGMVNLSSEQLCDNIAKISRVCFHKFMSEKNSADQCLVVLSCLECFKAATKFIAFWQPKRLQQFVSTVYGEGVQTQSSLLSNLVKQLQRVLVSFIASDSPLTASERKLVAELLEMLDLLFTIALLNCSKTENEQFSDWWRKVCCEYQLEDAFTSKFVVQQHLRSALLMSNHPELPFRDFAADIRTHLATNDSEQSQPTYKVICSENAQGLVPVVIKHLDSVLADCDWLLSYVKSSISPRLASTKEGISDDIQEDRRKIEGSLCIHICTLGVGLLDLLMSSFDSMTAIDSVISGLTTLFNFLTQLSKYYLWLYGQSIGSISTRFEKLISFIGSEMMRPIYAFIMHAQTTQTSKLGDGKSKKAVNTHTAGKAKVLRESKNISKLVFSIEQHEHNLIILTRRSKMDLMKNYHLPTSRDFRIRTDVIHVAMNEQAASKDGNEDEENEEDNPTSSKRPRLET